MHERMQTNRNGSVWGGGLLALSLISWSRRGVCSDASAG